MRYLTLSILLIITVSAFGQTPTTPASNIVFTFTGCNEIDISWTNGNGSDRIVFMREGASVSNVPEYNEYYSEHQIFTQGESIKGDKTNFCVYKGPGSSVKVKGLKNSTKYCIAIFEYNKVTGSYDYKVDTYPTACITTKNITAKFTITPGSQCLHGNSFNFNNLSSSDITPMNFRWDFEDGDSSHDKNPVHSYKKPGIWHVKLTAEAKGCYNSAVVNDTVNEQPFVRFDLDPAKPFNDSVQCGVSNRFIFRNKTTFLDLVPTTYKWYSDKTLFATGFKAEINFKTPGTRTIKLVAVTKYGCSDSTFHVYKLLGGGNIDPSKVSVTPKSMSVDNNKFTFVNNSPLCKNHVWYLKNISGNGFSDTVQGQTVNYSFKTKGIYAIALRSLDSINNCLDIFHDTITVLPSAHATSFNLKQSISIYPNPSNSGVFEISNLPTAASIKVFDIIGKELLNLNPGQSNTKLNLTQFGAGTYILTIQSEERRFDHRLVVL